MERLNFENLGFVKMKKKTGLHLSLTVGNDFATEPRKNDFYRFYFLYRKFDPENGLTPTEGL